MLKKTSLSIIILFIVAIKGQAHDLWIHSPNYTPEFYKKFGATLTLYTGWGHVYPIDEVYTGSAEFSIHEPNNEVKIIEEKLLGHKEILKQEGNYILSGKLKPYYWTSYYDSKGKRAGKREPKGDLKNIISSKQYNRYAKSIVSTGKTKDTNFSKVLGDTLEIIPLENPNSKEGNGEYLKVKLLFKGKPLAYTKINGTYAGFSNQGDYAMTTMTNVEGIAKVKLIHLGYWLLRVDHTEPAPTELRDKCDEIYYTTSLTFQVK
jgi:uncharacterized GH25 family protein